MLTRKKKKNLTKFLELFVQKFECKVITSVKIKITEWKESELSFIQELSMVFRCFSTQSTQTRTPSRREKCRGEKNWTMSFGCYSDWRRLWSGLTSMSLRSLRSTKCWQNTSLAPVSGSVQYSLSFYFPFIYGFPLYGTADAEINSPSCFGTSGAVRFSAR